jgi:hypothetical protein
MANEFKHKDPGTALTQAEFIASDGTGHIFDSQAQGDVLFASSTTELTRLGKDANATRALTNTGTNNNPAWAQIALATGVSGTLPVANGGTGATTLTDKAVLISQDTGTDTVGSVALTSSGQIIIGGSSGPAAATLTEGSNITITNGDGSISIAAASGGIASLAADTSPQVGGSAGLDLQAQLLVGNGGTTGIAISANGEVNMAAQPSVFVFNSSDDANQTGNNSLAVVDLDTEVFDQNGDFASDTFTAPVTGRYMVLTQVALGTITTPSSMHIELVASNRTIFSGQEVDPGGSDHAYSINALIDMDASDTFQLKTRCNGQGADTIDIVGNASVRTYVGVQMIA